MVSINSIKFTDEYTGTGASKNDFLMGSFADIITAYIDVDVHWESIGILTAFDSTAKTMKRLDNYSFITDGFKVGDTFHVTNPNSGINDGDYTITAITDSTITVSGAISTTGVYTLVNFNGTTQVNALDFYYNLIENKTSLTFTSLTDNQSNQKVSASKTNWVATETVSFVKATTSIGWQTGSGSVIKNSISNLASSYKQNFVITHNFQINPLYLSGQPTRVDSKLIYPTYFDDINSLKYVARVDARYNTTNPSIPHTTDPNYNYALGNVGWFNEFLNGGTPDYTLASITYTDMHSSTPLSQVELSTDTQVVAVLNSASGSFLGGGIGVGSLIALNFFYCPDDQYDYVNTTTNLRDNFRLDRKLLTLDAASVDGNRFGTDYQALTSITAVYNSPNQCTLTFTVSLAEANKTFFKGKSDTNRKYMLMATPQKKTATSLATTDRNAVLLDFNSMSWNKDDATLLYCDDIHFFEYPETINNGKTDYKGFIGDHVFSKFDFVVSNTATPLSLTAKINVVNSTTGESFTLQQYTQQFASTDGSICSDNVPTILGYNLPVDDVRNQAFLSRNVAFDGGGLFGYTFNYGFVLRYEGWRKLTDYPQAFNCSHTQDWSTYGLVSASLGGEEVIPVLKGAVDLTGVGIGVGGGIKADNWTLKYVISVDVLSNDYITTFERSADIVAVDDSFTDNGFGSDLVPLMNTYYLDNNYVDAKDLILEDQDTHVKLNIKGDFTSLPADAIGYWGYLALDVEGTGGELTRDVTTSEADPLDSSVWQTKAFINKVSDTILTIESDIDFTKLDYTVKSYLITARFGFKQ